METYTEVSINRANRMGKEDINGNKVDITKDNFIKA
jgi:hypothetical protein